MDITTLGTVTAIVAICYLIGLAVKAIPNIKDNLIPVIVGLCGGALGVARAVPDARISRRGRDERRGHRHCVRPRVHRREPGV